MQARIKRNNEDGIEEEMIICGIDYKDIDNQVYELNRHIGIFSKWSVDRYDLSKSNDFDDF